MAFIDALILVLYILAMLSVGYYFLRQNQSEEEYYVGGRNMGAWHIGFSVVATDVGGGFSIGLGGLGFVMGLSGSWMLLTGLIGAWLAAWLLIPRVFKLSRRVRLFTFPQIFRELYGEGPAVLAAIISLIGYIGFTSSQLLAGAKLASGTFSGISLQQALLIMGGIAVVYTVMGGIKAVIYTDTAQWIILLSGLLFVALPLGYSAVGGYQGMVQTLPAEFFSLDNVGGITLLNWAITIVPIWFIGMTLYQRIYASRDEATARKAWILAGLLEWPVMAFLGVGLGLLGRVALEQGLLQLDGTVLSSIDDPETALPILLNTVLPTGMLGLVMAAYFSAVLSTADSCLMAASGNLSGDLLYRNKTASQQMRPGVSQLLTLVLGAVALLIALYLESVLQLMLLSYAFMVSGLFVPLVAGLFFGRSKPRSALASMLLGGSSTLLLSLLGVVLPWGLDPIAAGLLLSALPFLVYPQSEKHHGISSF
jgi:solute:Na+ symporter, SSS family